MVRLRRLVGTVRFRITACATVAVLVVLLVTAFGLLVTQRRLLTEAVDEAILQNADEIEQRLRDGEPLGTLIALGEDDTVAQVVRDGDVSHATPKIDGEPPLGPTPPDGQDQTLETVDGLLGEDVGYRLLSRRVATPSGDAVIYVAATLDDIDESVNALATGLFVAIPTVVALLAALIWWLVGRTLRPVEAIRSEVAAIGGGDLHRRVPTPAGDDEIARLAHTMNDMLERVDHAAKRQQRFVADASHELRSPLTRIRAAIEVDLAHPAHADADATHRSVLEEAVGLQRLVDDLLHLARSDARATASSQRSQPVDLDDLVVRLARRLRDDGRVEVDIAGVTAAQVTGDPDQLARALGNVVDNAARHAASRVTFTLGERDHVALLTVSDDGPGVPPDQRERIFERFTRLDEARRSTTGGAGLGLAISRDIVEHHRGHITVDADHHPGARFVITLPLSNGAE